MRILLVEDDELLGDGLQSGLTEFHHTVDWLKDGMAGRQALEMENFDVAVIDLGLPKLSGIDLIKQIRVKKVDTPILILTARDGIEDRVAGLDAGADDYLTKPFDLDELAARIRALHRRKSGNASNLIKYEDIELDPAAHKVSKNGENVTLPRREFALLQKLLENQDRVISRDSLSQALYGWEDEVDSNTLEVHIHNLRKKFGNQLIRTIRGVGYVIEKPKNTLDDTEE